MKRVGFIGLGAMGGPMARNLAAAGFELAVFDVDAQRTRAAAEELGAGAARSASDVAFGADALVVMVLTSRPVRGTARIWWWITTIRGPSVRPRSSTSRSS